MTASIDSQDPEDELWLKEKVNRLLKECFRRGVNDVIVVRVFGELVVGFQSSAEGILETLKMLQTTDPDENDPMIG